jgi:deoxyribodipyrimidine photo-lyase
MGATIVWFRQDLRLQDNPALAAAIKRGEPVIPVFIWAPSEEGAWPPGAASQWWLHHALQDLLTQLHQLGSRLLIEDAGTGSSLDSILSLARQSGADHVYWNRRYEPAAIARDKQASGQLSKEGIRTESFNSAMLLEPPDVKNKSGRPFRVFTPLWNHYRTRTVPDPVHVDLKALRNPITWPQHSPLDTYSMLPSTGWDCGLKTRFGIPARADLLTRFDDFSQDRAGAYPDTRDYPAMDGTTLLSPALHWGQIGPREIWKRLDRSDPAIESGLMRQLIWREFAHHLLVHFPQTTQHPLRSEFLQFPWREDPGHLRSWQQGETGYPIVDAGMRQLWQTGWMHNRVRMIVGSLLVKHLLGHWLEGARWFWDTLVDADLANNTFGWQWIAGCGADAAPYFRIFNPIIQGERFDPGGTYVKTYLPELNQVPAKFIHRPWDLSDLELAGYGVKLGQNYPRPVIEHAQGRARALEAFQANKSRAGNHNLS